MKKNIKLILITAIFGLAFTFSACNFSANNEEKEKKKTNTEVPAKKPSNNTPENTDIESEEIKLPLTLQAITNGKIILSGKSSFEKVQIQKNDGLIVDASDNISVQTGDKIRFYAKNYKYKDTGTINLTIDSTADCYIYGNVMSLIYFTDFAGKTEITDNYVLQKLFLNNTHVKNHESLELLLPATTLSDSCYKMMFYGCTGLTIAPELPATTLTKECYKQMFCNCSNLNSIKCLASDISAQGCTANWIENVATTGTFTSVQENNIWHSKDIYSGIPRGWTANPQFEVVNAKELPLTLEAVAAGSIKLKNISEYINLKYSINNGKKTAATTAIEVNAGDKVSFYAEGPLNVDTTSLNIDCTSDCYVYGNIMSLIAPDDFTTKTQLTNANTFYELFKDNTHIRNCAVELVLPATTLAPSCYYAMFRGCTGITTAPELPAMELADVCYRYMFYDCSSLTAVPDLPATTLVAECYYYMFGGCKSLLKVQERLPATILAENCYNSMFAYCTSLLLSPELPATTLAANCYDMMFNHCTSLTAAPELPATTLAKECYSWMFWNCTSLTTAPELPATTLEYGCYKNMFYQCKNLTKAPDLPATTLKPWCYRCMFSDCSNLVTAPELLATEIPSDCENCYYCMFSDCSKLSYVVCKVQTVAGSDDFDLSTEIPNKTTPYCHHWLDGTAANGILITPTPAKWPAPAGWKQEKQLPLTLEAVKDGTITIKNTSNYTEMSFYKNYAPMENLISNEVTIDVIAGDKIWICADGITNNYNSAGSHLNINCDSLCYVYGNIMSLVKKTDYSNETGLNKNSYFYGLFYNNKNITNHPVEKLLLPATTLTKDCYDRMFMRCINLVEAPELPATTMKESCYDSMFDECTSLVKAPELPATTLANDCYCRMFANCSSLVSAPELPATQMWSMCYNCMFLNCSKLKEAPALPATNLNESCYNGMFSGCSSLVQAPALPATTLEPMCYDGMFEDCTSLKNAPALPATSFVYGPVWYQTAYGCYERMFKGCTSLVQAPALPATELSDMCYSYMFSGCTSLVNAPGLPATELTEECYERMFENCSSLVNAPELKAMSLESDCYSYMFSGCTGLVTAPELPATTLKNYCYSYMFSGCTNLTTVPVLPATTLVKECYREMFKGCLKLNYIKCLANPSSSNESLSQWTSDVSLTGTFVKATAMNDWPTGPSGIPIGWTVVEAQ